MQRRWPISDSIDIIPTGFRNSQNFKSFQSAMSSMKMLVIMRLQSHLPSITMIYFKAVMFFNQHVHKVSEYIPCWPLALSPSISWVLIRVITRGHSNLANAVSNPLTIAHIIQRDVCLYEFSQETRHQTIQLFFLHGTVGKIFPRSPSP